MLERFSHESSPEKGIPVSLNGFNKDSLSTEEGMKEQVNYLLGKNPAIMSAIEEERKNDSSSIILGILPLAGNDSTHIIFSHYKDTFSAFTTQIQCAKNAVFDLTKARAQNNLYIFQSQNSLQENYLLFQRTQLDKYLLSLQKNPKAPYPYVEYQYDSNTMNGADYLALLATETIFQKEEGFNYKMTLPSGEEQKRIREEFRKKRRLTVGLLAAGVSSIALGGGIKLAYDSIQNKQEEEQKKQLPQAILLLAKNRLVRHAQVLSYTTTEIEEVGPQTEDIMETTINRASLPLQSRDGLSIKIAVEWKQGQNITSQENGQSIENFKGGIFIVTWANNASHEINGIRWSTINGDTEVSFEQSSDYSTARYDMDPDFLFGSGESSINQPSNSTLKQILTSIASDEIDIATESMIIEKGKENIRAINRGNSEISASEPNSGHFDQTFWELFGTIPSVENIQ